MSSESVSSRVPVDLLSLPNEVLIKIASHLAHRSSNDVILLLQSCRRLYDACLPFYMSSRASDSPPNSDKRNGGPPKRRDHDTWEPPILPNCIELECMGIDEYDKRGDRWFCRSQEWAMCCPKLKLLRFYNSDWPTARDIEGAWRLTPAVTELHQKGIKVAQSLDTLSLGKGLGRYTVFDDPIPSFYPPQGFLNLRWVQHLILDECCSILPMRGYRSLDSVRTLSMNPRAYKKHECFVDIAGSFPNLQVTECVLPRNIDSIIFPKTTREPTIFLPETGEYIGRKNALLQRMCHLEGIISSGTLPQLRLLRLKTGAEGMLDNRVPAVVRSTQLDLACVNAGVDFQLQLG